MRSSKQQDHQTFTRQILHMFRLLTHNLHQIHRKQSNKNGSAIMKVIWLNSEVVLLCVMGKEWGRAVPYRGTVGTVTLTSISAMALISSSQFIREGLLLPQALEMFIRIHITHAVRMLCCWSYTQHIYSSYSLLFWSHTTQNMHIMHSNHTTAYKTLCYCRMGVTLTGKCMSLMSNYSCMKSWRCSQNLEFNTVIYGSYLPTDQRFISRPYQNTSAIPSISWSREHGCPAA